MTSIFFALAMLAIIVLLLSRLLKTATSALSEATDFARDLTNIRGQEIPFHHSSIEIEQLCLALNQTSLRLHIQETELANSNRLLGNVLSSSSKMAIIATDLNGCITVFNRGAELLLGYTADAMIAKESLLSFHLPAELQAREHELSASLGYAVQGLRAIVEIPELQGAEQREWIYVTKTGAQIPVALVITTMRSDDGRITGYLGIAQDITERLRNDRLKTQFISTVSHELRTPLTAVVGALGLVSGGALGAIPEKAQQMIRIAHKNSQRLTYLINDLLDIEKLAAGKMHFDMKSQALIPLIEQAIENNRTYSTDRQIKLILASTEGNPNVYVDTQRLQQILSNLISNAIKYSPDGGTVVIAVQTHENRVRVTVSDSGAGIPPEFYDRIFQKFSQADSSDTRQKGGTGLGLAITRELVERMGGDIGFSSTLGQGTSFYFDFPLQREHAACTVSAQEPDEKNGSRILIIEDEPDIAHLLSIILTRAGYVADIALNGTEALIALKQKQYAAVTLDLMLPDISGLEIIRQIRSRKETLDTPIIVVSAKMEEGRLAINSNFSHIDWLAKPIDDSRLLSILDKNLTGKNEHRLRVLHIEDDTDLHATILTMAGERFYFEFATTLNEARARMKQVHLDLVILDLKLPDGSGWELLPEIRAHYPHIRVVILTGNDIMPNDADKADAILLNSKISPDELLRELDKRILPAQQQ